MWGEEFDGRGVAGVQELQELQNKRVRRDALLWSLDIPSRFYRYELTDLLISRMI